MAFIVFLSFFYYNIIMIVTEENLKSKEQTGNKMYYLVNKYHNDLRKVKVKKNDKIKPLLKLSLIEYFNFIKLIPYKRDIKPIEVIGRPKVLLKNRQKGLDCKKKAILIGAYLKNKNIPYRFMSTSKLLSGKIHHVFPQINLDGSWKNLDATYSYYKPFERKKVTAYKVL